MRVSGIPLGVGNSILPSVLPTAIYLFNGSDGATTDTNSSPNPTGSISFFSGTVISTAKSYEGSGSVRLSGGFVDYSPEGTGNNSKITGRDFYFSVAFNTDGNDNQQRGLMRASSPGGTIFFRAYLVSGQVKCYIRQGNGVAYTVTVPNLSCTADTWYKLEVSRKFATNEFKVKVGTNEVTQALTADFSEDISRLMVGVWWDGDAWFIGYIDRLIYQVGSITPY